jgi:hypothetical protein
MEQYYSTVQYSIDYSIDSEKAYDCQDRSTVQYSD